MKTQCSTSIRNAICLAGGSFRHGRALLLGLTLATRLLSQPASLTSSPAQVNGPAVFDAAGNMYFFQFGTVTSAAAQTLNGGGICLTSNGFFNFAGPCPDAYAGKADRTGKMVFGTLLGGGTADQSTALAVDDAGSVFVTGTTAGLFPTTPGAAVSASTTSKAFAARISADGSRILYSTYLPDQATIPAAIAVDQQGNAYIAGTTGTGHVFVTKLSADGSAILYNVSLGGGGQDAARAIMVDTGGNVTLTGQTNSPDFPVSQGALQSRLKGMQNVFVARLDTGGRVVFSTYVGGSGTDTPAALQADSAGNIYVAGQTSSPDFPTTSGSLQPAANVPLWNNTAPGGFVAGLKADGSGLVWSTYVMSSDHFPQQGVTQMAVSGAGEVYIAGLAGSLFPVTASAPQICFDGPANDVFVARLDTHGALLDATYVGQNGYAVQGMRLAANGSVLLVATSEGGVVRSEIRFGGTGWSARACLSPSILNSATLSGGPVVVPGEFVTLTGFGIGPDSGIAYQPDAQGRIPQQLGGVQVLVDGQPVPVLYAQSRQINALLPVELSGQAQTSLTVVYNQAAMGLIAAKVAAFGAPGIFRREPGVASQAAALNQDGTLNSSVNPAARGSVVAIWGTGFGLIDPPCATGGLNPPVAAGLAAGLGVSLADAAPGVAVRFAPALYAGSAPTLPCGVEQINMLVPGYLSPGLYQFYPSSAMNLEGGAKAVAQGTVSVTIYVK